MTETHEPRRRLVNRPAVLALAAVLAIVALSLLGRWGWKTYLPAIRFGGAGISLGSAPDRQALVVGLDGCIAGEGMAKVVAVRPMETTGEVRVSAFATNPTDTEPVMTADEPISRLRGYSGDSIAARCGGLSQSVAVQIVADSYPATVGYLEVDYEVHGITRTATADYDLTFYNGPTPDDDCEDADLPPMGEADCEASTTFG